jgi:hypothetical protein
MDEFFETWCQAHPPERLQTFRRVAGHMHASEEQAMRRREIREIKERSGRK